MLDLLVGATPLIVSFRKKSEHEFYSVNHGTAARCFRSSGRITDWNKGNGPEVIGQVQNVPYTLFLKSANPARPEAKRLGRKKQVLNARSSILDTVQVHASLSVLQG